MKLSLAQKLKESLKMFLVFFKIGLFSFGGGYAMLTMIEHEVVEKRGWLTHNELLDIFAIAESTPGAISINIATFIGTKRAGVIGGCITTFGVVLPAFLVIFALSYVLDLVRDNVWVNALFKGVRVGVVVLIIHAALKFLKEMKKKVVTVLLAVAMFCLAAFSSVNVIYLMLGSIGISIVAVAVAHAWARKKFLMAVSVGTPVYTRKGVALDPDLNADRSSSDGVKNSKDITPNGGFDVEEALGPASDAARSSSEDGEILEHISPNKSFDIEEGEALDPDLNNGLSSSEGVKNSEDVASGERADIEEGDAIDTDADGVNEDEGGRKDA